MGLPKIVVNDRQVILLSGYSNKSEGKRRPGGEAGPDVIEARDKLKQAVRKNPDAVAFGYVVGEWVAGA